MKNVLPGGEESPAMQEMQEMWIQLLENKMATHSIILARKIPQTEEPGGLQGHKESDMTERLSTPSIKYEQDNHFQVENINAALSSPPQFFLSV